MIFAGRWHRSDTAWLALAITAHALLLLLPLERPETRMAGRLPMMIHLVPVSPVAARYSEPADSLSAEAATAEKIRPGTVAAVAPVDAAPVPSQPPAADPKSALKLPTTAALLASARTALLNLPVHDTGRRLGAHTPTLRPASRQRGAGIDASRSMGHLYRGMSVSNRTEIVDRWLAADGSQNEVVTLPGGQTVCGRAEAWNPLQPLVEHVMQFRRCGGGGQRTVGLTVRDSPLRTAARWSETIK